MELPVLFEERMRRMLPPEEYEQFLKSYEREQYHALRVNTLKIRRKEFLERGLFDLEPVPWCENGFYYGENERPGKHPFHEAGLYYIQEPSAMSAAALADVQPGEYVLDLCAAPGGKSTQLASALQGQGLLVANEIHPARAKILSQNIERMGGAQCAGDERDAAEPGAALSCVFRSDYSGRSVLWRGHVLQGGAGADPLESGECADVCFPSG